MTGIGPFTLERMSTGPDPDDCDPVLCDICGSDVYFETQAIHRSSSPAYENPYDDIQAGWIAWNDDESWQIVEGSTVMKCDGCNVYWEIEEDENIWWEWE